MIVEATRATKARGTTASAMNPRSAEPIAVIELKKSRVSVQGAIEGGIKCLMNRCLDIHRVPRSLYIL